MVEDNLKDNKREDNPKAKAFIEDFFNKYSSSKSDDMAYLMDNPEGLLKISLINMLLVSLMIWPI